MGVGSFNSIMVVRHWRVHAVIQCLPGKVLLVYVDSVVLLDNVLNDRP